MRAPTSCPSEQSSHPVPSSSIYRPPPDQRQLESTTAGVNIVPIETIVSKRAVLLFLVLATPSPWAASAATQDKSLHDQIDAAVQSLRIKGAKIGVVVYSVKSDRTVFGLNERESFLLASNTKLLTTSAA